MRLWTRKPEWLVSRWEWGGKKPEPKVAQPIWNWWFMISFLQIDVSFWSIKIWFSFVQVSFWMSRIWVWRLEILVSLVWNVWEEVRFAGLNWVVYDSDHRDFMVNHHQSSWSWPKNQRQCEPNPKLGSPKSTLFLSKEDTHILRPRLISPRSQFQNWLPAERIDVRKQVSTQGGSSAMIA
jgi:hypothetical protein